MKFAHYCTCGAKWTGSISPRADYEKLKGALWDADHSGPGHEPTDAATAGRVRRREDEKARLAEINSDIAGLEWTL